VTRVLEDRLGHALFARDARGRLSP
jgi:DNA-binding transcriptional LysR family regulator